MRTDHTTYLRLTYFDHSKMRHIRQGGRRRREKAAEYIGKGLSFSSANMNRLYGGSPDALEITRALAFRAKRMNY